MTLQDAIIKISKLNKKFEKAICCLQKGYTEVTLQQMHTLVESNKLNTGSFYGIIDADQNLYGGTLIILQAISKNQLSETGHGVFYNPKYDRNDEFIGMWHKIGYFTGLNLAGNFEPNEPITANNGATGLVVGFAGEYKTYFVPLTGDWTTATSLTGDNSSATLDIINIHVPSYGITDRVIWGGYLWENIDNSVGFEDDIYELNYVSWEKIPYNDVDYDLVVDPIMYDYANNLIVARTDNFGNTVKFNNETSIVLGNLYGGASNPIKAFKWGYHYNTVDGQGFMNNKIENSIFENIHWYRTHSSYGNQLLNLSAVYNNSYVINNYFYNNHLDHESTIKNNICFLNSYIQSNILFSNSSINNNILVNFSTIINNELHSSTILENQLNGNSNITSNILKQNSAIQTNYFRNSGNLNENSILYSSYIQDNELTDGSYIRENIIEVSSEISENVLTTSCFLSSNRVLKSSNISQNELEESTIANNILDLQSILSNNVLEEFSTIEYNSLLANSTMQYNEAYNNSFIGENTLVIGNITSNILEASYLQFNQLKNSYISSNTCTTSSIVSNTLAYASYIDSNTLLNANTLGYNTLNSSYLNGNTINLGVAISNNNLFSSTFVFVNIANTITAITATSVNTASVDIALATIIYQTYSKNMITDSVGVPKITYINGAGTLQVVALTT